MQRAVLKIRESRKEKEKSARKCKNPLRKAKSTWKRPILNSFGKPRIEIVLSGFFMLGYGKMKKKYLGKTKLLVGKVKAAEIALGKLELSLKAKSKRQT